MRGERKPGHLHCMGMAFRAFMQVFLSLLEGGTDGILCRDLDTLCLGQTGWIQELQEHVY